MNPSMKSGPLFSTANLMSFFRAGFAPVILLLLMAQTQATLYGALFIVCLAAASDIADGYIARRHASPSEFGRYLDGACDAIFNFAVFLGFLANDWLAPAAFAAIYFAEIVVPYLGAFAKQIGCPFKIRWSARLKTIIHPVAQIVVITMAAVPQDPYASVALLALGAAIVVSMAYLIDHAVLTIRHTLQPA